MPSYLLLGGLVATLSGCALLWSTANRLQQDDVATRMQAAERAEALGPLQRLQADAVRVEPDTDQRPAPGTKVILTAEVRAMATVTDPDLGLKRDGDLLLIRDVAFWDARVRSQTKEVWRPYTYSDRFFYRNGPFAPRKQEVTEKVSEGNWTPVTQAGADFPWASVTHRVPVMAGHWPVSADLIDRIENGSVLTFDEGVRQRVVATTSLPVRLHKGQVVTGKGPQLAEGDHRILAWAVPSGRYTILAAWDGKALTPWQDPNGDSLGLMQPGELADMVPPSMREDALQPLSWSQRLQARPDLMIPASLGGLLAVAGLGSICFGLMAGRSRLSSSTWA